MQLRASAVAALTLLLIAPGARAGQRRVDVGASGGFSFAPLIQTLNIGDHVTWVVVSGSHTVTNGFDPDFDPNAGTIFDAGVGSTGAFTWKADRTGTLDYLCRPHFPSMVGQLNISASGVAVSSFRITEVQYNAALGRDRIEITNLGSDFGDLGRYRIAIGGSSVSVPLANVAMVSGASPGRVIIHTNEGTSGSTATDLFMGGIGDLSAVSGSVALYAPNTFGTLLTDATQIIDFVQWGAGNQPNVATAVTAGVWPSASEFVDLVPVVGDYDLVFCGTESQRGSAQWKVAHPNFRSQPLCSTPAVTTSWGRIKLLYR